MGVLKTIGSLVLLLFFLLALNQVFGIFTNQELWFLRYLS